MTAPRNITLRDFHLATATDDQCIAWLRENRLLATEQSCARCRTAMVEEQRVKLSDGRHWRCTNKKCKTNCTIRKGSFFEQSKIPLQKIIDIIIYWSLELSNGHIQHEVFISQYMFQ